MLLRMALSITLGAAVTLALLLMMHALVGFDRPVEARGKRYEINDLVRVEREVRVESVSVRPERPPAPELPPQRPSPEYAPFGDALAVSVAAPATSLTIDVSLGSLPRSDGEYLPVVTVAPSYPSRALAAKLEGYVLVEFVVTANGSVRDVVVLESTASIFERPAIEAALRFKFKPRVIDGQAIEVHGVKNRIVFELDA